MSHSGDDTDCYALFKSLYRSKMIQAFFIGPFWNWELTWFFMVFIDQNAMPHSLKRFYGNDMDMV
ncbi:hypothetical protein B7P33_12340 [Sediminicola luteus]|uniref:Uncharacterized protein n=1 Tax=Sediminicola luteus TaxID=319238 RepID=A0A2A4G4Y8_9FLAO|nr:hypothetical protein B7P33_12340 [Sediminicola luteus]